MSVQDRVHELLEPVVATLDVELVDVEFTGGTLRITVDQGDGISTELLTAVNRLISPILDQHDPIPGRYTLEVSSPGLERPLRRLVHYERAVGENVVLKMLPAVEPRRVKGRLLEVGGSDEADGSVAIEVFEVDGVDLKAVEQREFPLADVATGRTIFDWGPGPKPGQPGAKKPGKPGSGAKSKAKKPSAKKSSAKKPVAKNTKSSKKTNTSSTDQPSEKASTKPSLNREVRDEQ